MVRCPPAVEHSVHYFVVTGDTVTAIPPARWSRITEGAEPLAGHTGPDAQLLEVVTTLEAGRRPSVVRVLPTRRKLREDGTLAVGAALSDAMLFAFGDPSTSEDAMRRLQQDASYFWRPSDAQLAEVATRLDGVSPDDLKQALQRTFNRD